MIYLLISFLLDNIMSFTINNSYQNITVLFPMILVSSLPISFTLTKNKKLYLFTLIIIGIINDTLYSNIFLFNTFYFILVYLFLKTFYSNRKITVLNLLITSIFSFICYDISLFFLLIFLKFNNFTINDLYYKIVNSLILNILYIICSLYIFKSRIFAIKKRKYIY